MTRRVSASTTSEVCWVLTTMPGVTVCDTRLGFGHEAQPTCARGRACRPTRHWRAAATGSQQRVVTETRDRSWPARPRGSRACPGDRNLNVVDGDANHVKASLIGHLRA